MDFKKIFAEYQQNGCLKIENFLTLEEVEEMKQALDKVIDKIPENGKTHAFSPYEQVNDDDNDDYYVSSGDKIGYFYEKDAFNEDGKLILDKKDALAKIAYALHWWNPVFKKYTFDKRVKDLLRTFQYKDPVIVQSMLIFKKPKIGEVFRPHQDSTFLYTEPPSCIGLWMPLEDATTENGCLWFLPGSHKGTVHQRFVRNPKKNPSFIMEGTIPDSRDDEWVSVPAKKGDCVLIHGSVLHKSGPNNTTKARTVYTFHAVEKDAPWSKANWVQPTEVLPFPSIYSN